MAPIPPTGEPAPIAPALLHWFEVHGRRHLPWQDPATPYRVWVSEVMLQQTQVATVIPYFERFMDCFPTVRALAAAHPDAVLHHWSGLGYYARARNLHRAAGMVADRHGGELPEDPEALRALPGIGRSTAGAILALARGRREPILDGNVKRVLARYHGVEGWTGQAAVQRQLWAWAEHHTPHERVARYTQAIMDLGALVCSRRRPRCEACPLQADCNARRTGRTDILPSPRPRKELPTRSGIFLVIENPDGEVLLERRPPSGIWGGLWCPPECEAGHDPGAWVTARLGLAPAATEPWPEMSQTFTHFRLTMRPVHVRVHSPHGMVLDGDRLLWYKTESPQRDVGVAAPVARLLRCLRSRGATSDP